MRVLGVNKSNDTTFLLLIGEDCVAVYIGEENNYHRVKFLSLITPLISLHTSRDKRPYKQVTTKKKQIKRAEQTRKLQACSFLNMCSQHLDRRCTHTCPDLDLHTSRNSIVQSTIYRVKDMPRLLNGQTHFPQ
jgi:hypothetical protein